MARCLLFIKWNEYREVVTSGGVEILITCLQSSREALVVNATTCLINMGHDFTIRFVFYASSSLINIHILLCRHDITKRGIIASLVQPLKSASARVQSKISEAIATYVTGVDTRTEVPRVTHVAVLSYSSYIS